MSKELKFFYHDTVTSTMDEAANVECGVVLARRQTNGRGRFAERSFDSEAGGLYMTVCGKSATLDRWTDIVTKTAHFVVASLSEFKVAAVVKQPNDVYVLGKKVCGIIARAQVMPGSGEVSGWKIGVGVNILNEIPQKLSSKAANIFELTGVSIDAEQLGAKIATMIYDYIEGV